MGIFFGRLYMHEHTRMKLIKFAFFFSTLFSVLGKIRQLFLFEIFFCGMWNV